MTDEHDIVHRLAGRLDLTRPLVFLDLETTGLNVEIDRIWELGALKLQPTGETSAFYSRFNPGIPVAIDAKAKTGITDDALKDEPPFADVARLLFDSLSGVDLAAFNGRRFDVKVLMHEFDRNGLLWGPGAPGWDALIVDPWAIWARQEPRDQKGALKRFAPDYADEAANHEAIGDVLGVVATIAGQINAFWNRSALYPVTVQELAEAGRDPDWIDDDGKIAWRNGLPCLTIGKHAGTPVRELPSGYVEWMLKAEFPVDVKTLIIEIRKGKIPARKD